MRIRSSALVFSALLAASSFAAHADTYTFGISTGSTSTTPGSSFTVNGTLTGTPYSTSPAAITLTDITGSGQGYTFTGVVPLGTESGLSYDNLLFTDPSATHVDSKGALLYLSSVAGTSLAHVYDNNGYHVDVFDPHDPADLTPFAIDTFVITPTAVPEPSTWMLLGTGVLALAGLGKRKLFQL
jgi:hypothetical protein